VKLLPDRNPRLEPDIAASDFVAVLNPVAIYRRQRHASVAPAGAACVAYLNHLQSAEPDLLNLLAGGAILDYVTGDPRSAEKVQCGWTESTRNTVRAFATQLIERPE